MDLLTGAIVAVLLVLLALGVHIGVALGAAGLLGILLAAGPDAAFAQLRSLPYNATAIYTLAVVPMFILMGGFFNRSGLTTDLYKAAHMWLGHLRGGLVMATTAGSGAFGAVTGSSVANAAVFSRISLPEMVAHGVDKRLAVGSIAASGTLASLIPPSLLLVIYGIITEQSVAMLLVAGLIPGLLSALIYLLGIYARVVRRPQLAPSRDQSPPWAQRFRSIGTVWPGALVFALVMGGIYSGLTTVTQAAALGAFGALAVSVAQARLNGRGVWESLQEAAKTTGSIMLIVVGGVFFARYMSYAGVVRELTDGLLGMNMPPVFYLLIFVALLFVLGMFLEAFAIMVLVLPLMVPILVEVGYNPIWLGVITIKMTEIGLITPPVGLNIYVVRSASPIPIGLNDIYAGVTPFLLLDVLTLAILVAFPSLVMFLPNIMVT